MEYLFMYLLQLFEKIDIINNFLLFTGGFIFVSWFVTLLFYSVEENKNVYYRVKPFLKICKKLFIKIFIIAICTMLIPTKQTLLLISGTYIGKKAVTAMSDSKKLEKISTIIDLKLDSYIRGSQEEAKNGTANKL